MSMWFDSSDSRSGRASSFASARPSSANGFVVNRMNHDPENTNKGRVHAANQNHSENFRQRMVDQGAVARRYRRIIRFKPARAGGESRRSCDRCSPFATSDAELHHEKQLAEWRGDG